MDKKSPKIPEKLPNNLESLKLASVKIPQIQEKISRDQKYYNPDSRNVWFKDCNMLYDTCPLHHSIIDKLYQKITNPVLTNPSGNTIQQNTINDKTFDKCVKDYLKFGGYAMRIRTNGYGDFLDKKYISFEKVRPGVPNPKTGQIEKFYFSNYWTNNTDDAVAFPNYVVDSSSDNPNEWTYNTSGDTTFIYWYHKDLNVRIFPRPYWYPGIDDIITSINISKINCNTTSHNISARKILCFNTEMTKEQRDEQKAKIENNLKGPNGDTIMLVFNPLGKDYAPQIISFNDEAQDQAYLSLLNESRTNICLAHQVPVALMGTLIPGSLGNNDLTPHSEAYNNDVVIPLRQEILDGYLKNNLIQ